MMMGVVPGFSWSLWQGLYSRDLDFIDERKKILAWNFDLCNYNIDWRVFQRQDIWMHHCGRRMFYWLKGFCFFWDSIQLVENLNTQFAVCRGEEDEEWYMAKFSFGFAKQSVQNKFNQSFNMEWEWLAAVFLLEYALFFFR